MMGRPTTNPATGVFNTLTLVTLLALATTCPAYTAST
jgi:hypothetical protein